MGLLYLFLSPTILHIALYALGYHTAKYKPSEHQMEVFLTQVRFPIYILCGTHSALLAYLARTNRFENAMAITLMSIASFVFILICLNGLTTRPIPYLVWLVIEIFSYVWAIRFGNKLKIIIDSEGGKEEKKAKLMR
jgi:hypothetical protein